MTASFAVTELLLSYFSASNINYVTIFNCWAPNENVELLKRFSNSTTYVDIVNLDDAEFDSILQADRITGRSRTQIGIVLDFNCPRSVEFFNKCIDLRCLTTAIQWVIVDQRENSSAFEHLSRANLFVDADLKVLVLEGLYDVFNNGRALGGSLNVTLDREILPDGFSLGPSKLDGKLKYEHRCNLSDVTMKVGTVTQLYPRVNDSMEKILKHLNSDKDRHVDHAVRLGLRLAKALHYMLGHKIRYIHYESWTFNDSTGGILGALVSGEIDYSVTGLMTKIKRMEHLASVGAYMTFDLMVMFKTPESSQLTDNAFIRPFGASVWNTIILTIVLGSIATKICFQFEATYYPLLKKTVNPAWFSLFVEFFGNYCQQGTQYIPRSYSGRLTQMTMLLCTLMVYNYYTSQIVSDLMGGHKESDIKNLIQLADSNIELGVENVIYQKAFFYESHLADVDYLTRKKVTDQTFVNSSTGIERIRRGNYAYSCERNVAYNLVRNHFDLAEVCDLNELATMPSQFVAHVTRKDSPFRELFHIRYTRIREVGVMKKFTNYWIAKKPECFSDGTISSLTITGALPIFVLFGFGLVLSVIMVGVERVVKTTSRKLSDRSEWKLFNISVKRNTRKKFL